MSSFQKMIGASLLIVSLSVAYYFVIYLPKKENAVIELQKQEQLKKEQKEQADVDKKSETKQLLDSCLKSAEINYTYNWNQTCKSRGLLSQSCIDLLDMDILEYYKQQNISSTLSSNEATNARLKAIDEFDKKKRDCSCMLPATASESIEKYRVNSKDECFKKYPQ